MNDICDLVIYMIYCILLIMRVRMIVMVECYYFLYVFGFVNYGLLKFLFDREKIFVIRKNLRFFLE